MRHLVLASLAAAPLAVALAAAPAAADPAFDPGSGPPGACDCAVPVAAPTPPPAPALPRWAIGLRLESTTLTPKDGGSDAKTQWGGGGLELRYRIAPRWELAASADGGREQLADGSQGDRVLVVDTLSARFHPRPYARWDLYAIAGVGVAQIQVTGAQPSAGDVRGEGELGVGLERRFGHLGVAAELRAMGIAAPKATADAAPAMTTTGATSGGTPPPAAGAADGSLDGGVLTISAAYHF